MVPLFPGTYDNDIILNVMATDEADQPGWYSNFGSIGVDVAAPGSDIRSTWLNGVRRCTSLRAAFNGVVPSLTRRCCVGAGTYANKTGTSQAAAHAAGAAALLLAAGQQAGLNVSGRGLDIRRTLLQYGLTAVPDLAGKCVAGDPPAVNSVAGDAMT